MRVLERAVISSGSGSGCSSSSSGVHCDEASALFNKLDSQQLEKKGRNWGEEGDFVMRCHGLSGIVLCSKAFQQLSGILLVQRLSMFWIE